MEKLQQIIEAAWDNKELLGESNTTDAIAEVLSSLDKGELRCASPDGHGDWVVNDWVKKAVILNFPIAQMQTI